MPKHERLVEGYLIKRVKETRGATRKMAWPGRRGAPDRWVGWSHLGKYAIIEVKEPDQPWGMQPHQQREIDLLRRCGMTVLVANGKEGVDACLRSLGIE